MRKYLAAALAATLTIAVPAVTFAAQTKAASTKTATHKAAPAKEKTAKGTVTAMDSSSLTLKTSKGEMKFNLDPSAKHDGVMNGSNVMVHYKAEGTSNVATNVMVETPKAAKATTAKTKKNPKH